MTQNQEYHFGSINIPEAKVYVNVVPGPNKKEHEKMNRFQKWLSGGGPALNQ